jgi:hypothetical protein
VGVGVQAGPAVGPGVAVEVPGPGEAPGCGEVCVPAGAPTSAAADPHPNEPGIFQRPPPDGRAYQLCERQKNSEKKSEEKILKKIEGLDDDK